MNQVPNIDRPAPDTAEAALAVAETAAAAPTWPLIVVMGLAVIIASRPRPDMSGRKGR